MAGIAARAFCAALLIGALQPLSAQQPAAPATAPATPMSDPRDFGGMWETAGFIPVVRNPPLLPAAQAKVDAYRDAQRHGRIIYTAWTSCRPGAISTMVMPMNSIAILQSPKEVTVLFEEPRMTRRLQIGAAPSKASLKPSYVGRSVAHWEGNTLVVVTTGFNGNFEIDAAGLPTSTQLRTTERYWKSDNDTINVATEIEDPANYSRPFTVNLKWKRAKQRHQLEYDCMENPRSEEFEHTLFIKDLYRPVCVAEQGQGEEKSHIVCRKPDEIVPPAPQ